MDAEGVVDAIGGQLAALNGLLKTSVGLAVLSAWAGLQNSKKISIFSMEVERKDAFLVLAFIFIFINFSVIMYFLRLADLIRVVPSEHLVAAITKLCTDSWALNPFSYFGGRQISYFNAALSYGALVYTWWIGLATLSLVVVRKGILHKVILLAFFTMGIVSHICIENISWQVTSRLRFVAPALDAELWGAFPYKVVASLVGLGAGIGTFFLCRHLQSQRTMQAFPDT